MGNGLTRTARAHGSASTRSLKSHQTATLPALAPNTRAASFMSANHCCRTSPSHAHHPMTKPPNNKLRTQFWKNQSKLIQLPTTTLRLQTLRRSTTSAWRRWFPECSWSWGSLFCSHLSYCCFGSMDQRSATVDLWSTTCNNYKGMDKLQKLTSKCGSSYN